MLPYSICGRTLYVGVLYMWAYSICGRTLYVGVLYMWAYSICGRTLYVGAQMANKSVVEIDNTQDSVCL